MADFERYCAEFAKTDPYTELQEFDPKTQDTVFKLKLKKALPPQLNGIAFDSIVNLRSALDQAGYAVAVANGGRGKNTHFPFHDDEAGVLGAKKGGSAEIPDEIFAVMASFKPYKGGNDLLWALNKLCNAHKHRFVSPMAVHNGAGTITGLRITGPAKILIPRWDYRKNEMEIARFGKEGAGSYDLTISFFISFSHVDPVVGKPAASVLRRMATEVERILMAVEAEARRIGLFK